jgi:hypothetical protein
MRLNRKVVALATSLLATGFADADGTRLTDREIRAAFAGHEFADGAHFRKRYARDGTLTGTSLGRRISGRWRVAGGLLCEVILGEESCFEVSGRGTAVRLTPPDTDAAILGDLR